MLYLLFKAIKVDISNGLRQVFAKTRRDEKFWIDETKIRERFKTYEMCLETIQDLRVVRNLETRRERDEKFLDPSLLISMTKWEKASYIFSVLIGQSATLIEFGIYVKIIHDLWHHDKEYLLNGTITRNMAQNRNRKNIISLRGQIACFLIETCCIATYFIGFVFKFEDSSSLNPIMTILSQSLVSIAQFFAPHEMQRFVKEKFEWMLYNKFDVFVLSLHSSLI